MQLRRVDTNLTREVTAKKGEKTSLYEQFHIWPLCGQQDAYLSLDNDGTNVGGIKSFGK